MENDFKKVQEEINDKYKHVADTITDGFRCFFLGIHKGKDGGLGFHGKDDNPDLTQWGPELPLSSHHKGVILLFSSSPNSQYR